MSVNANTFQYYSEFCLRAHREIPNFLVCQDKDCVFDKDVLCMQCAIHRIAYGKTCNYDRNLYLYVPFRVVLMLAP